MRTSVLIAGGGPAGLAMASELSFHGIHCTVVEPRSSVSMLRPRAKTTSVRTMEHFRRWGVASAIREAAYLSPDWSDRVVFCSSLCGEVITSFSDVFGLGEETLAFSAERGQQIPQPVVEKVLRDHLAASPFVTFLYEHRVAGFVESAQDVTATVVDESGREHEVVVDFLIGCDGANSAVRKAAGIAFVGTSDARPNFNFLFRAPELEPSVGDAVQYWVIGGPSPVVTGRLDHDGLWWVIAPGVDEAEGATSTARIVENMVGRPIEHSVVSTDSWTARLLVAERFRRGRVFLVGESAHLNPPWGGHGFNTCVGDAVNLGWKLAAVIKGWATDALLDSYESERRPIAVETIEVAKRNMAALPNELRADRAEEIQSSKDAEFHGMGIVLGYSYGDLPPQDSSRYVPTTTPGSRLPHVALEDGRAFHDLLGPEFTVVLPSGTDPSILTEAASKRGLPLTVVESPENYPWRDQILLVRPDQHIASRVDSLDAASVETLFSGIPTRLQLEETRSTGNRSA